MTADLTVDSLGPYRVNKKLHVPVLTRDGRRDYAFPLEPLFADESDYPFDHSDPRRLVAHNAALAYLAPSRLELGLDERDELRLPVQEFQDDGNHLLQGNERDVDDRDVYASGDERR